MEIRLLHFINQSTKSLSMHMSILFTPILYTNQKKIFFLCICSSPISSNLYLNFTRGSLIELSNGSLRRVEELRTEDFVMSADKSQDLQLADSTVVKILPAINNYVMITFSYDNSRSKVNISRQQDRDQFLSFWNFFSLFLGRHRG